MNLRDLEAFMAVVDTGSIGAAARRLNLTQPAVTRRVQNLEQDLGAPLLRRESKPPRLTIDGEIVAVSGRQVLRAVDDLRAGVAAEGEPNGQLRLGVAQAVGDLALGKPIGALRAAYPQLAVQLVSGWTRTLLAQVGGGGLDAAAILLREGVAPPADVAGHPVSREEIVVVAAKRLALPPAARLSDLRGHAWVLNPEGCGYRTAIRRALEREGAAFTVAVDIIGLDPQLSTVAEGVGLGLVPKRVLATSRFRDVLQAVALEDFQFGVTIWVVGGRALGRLAAPVTCFRDALAAALAVDA